MHAEPFADTPMLDSGRDTLMPSLRPGVPGIVRLPLNPGMMGYSFSLLLIKSPIVNGEGGAGGLGGPTTDTPAMLDVTAEAEAAALPFLLPERRSEVWWTVTMGSSCSSVLCAST